MKVFAVIVTYNGMKWYNKCIGYLNQSSIPVLPVIVDNASSDGTQDYIKATFPEAKFIESSENLGFAKANNIGIRYAYDNGADYILLLNQDAWIFHDTIDSLLKTFRENVDAGIVSPMHLNGEMDALDFNFATNMSGDFVSDCYLNKLKSNYPVPYINAACWLISRKCIETVGGFDTNLFVHYGEDTDYCKRLIYHKLKLYISTYAKACHDRSYRKNNNDKYTMSIFKRNERQHRMKDEYSNINIDYDFYNIINSYKKSIIKLYFHFNFSKVKQLKEDISLIEKIMKSRSNNITKGKSWLY